MKNPLLDWVLLIPWTLQFLLLLSQPAELAFGFENPFRPRGASLFNSRTSSTLNSNNNHSNNHKRAQSYYYYDPIAPPVSVRQRRQRQFGAEQLIAPVVVLQTGRAEPARVQIKELPPREALKSVIRSRIKTPASSGFFVSSSSSPTFPPTPPPPPPPPPPTSTSSTSAATSFARFNQFGSTLFTIATGPPSRVSLSAQNVGGRGQTDSTKPPELPRNRFISPRVNSPGGFAQPVTQSVSSLPQPEPIVGRVRTTSIIPTQASPVVVAKSPPQTTRTLFTGFTSRSTTTPSTNSVLSSSTTSLGSSATAASATGKSKQQQTVSAAGGSAEPTSASFATTLSQRTLTTTSRFLRPRVIQALTSGPPRVLSVTSTPSPVFER